MKKLSLLFFMVLLVMSVGCKKEKITLVADKTTIVANGEDAVSFIVKTENGGLLTDKASILINDKPLNGTTFKTSEAGTFKAVATYKDQTSEVVTIAATSPVAPEPEPEPEPEPGAKTVVIKADRTTLCADGIDLLQLSSVDAENEELDMTKETEFFVNGKKLEDYTLSSTQVGEVTITGKHKGKDALPLTVTVQNNFLPVPKIYVELFTGTWCAYCPKGIKTITEIKKRSTQVVATALHFDGARKDPFKAKNVGPFTDAMNVNSLPFIVLGRISGVNLVAKEDVIIEKIPTESPIGMAVRTTLSDSEIKGKVTFRTDKDVNSLGKLKWVAILTEDGLKADQANGVFSQLGDPIKDMIHNDVYRRSYNGIFGEELTFMGNGRVEKSFGFSTDGVITANYNITILVTNANTHQVVAVQRVQVGKSIGY